MGNKKYILVVDDDEVIVKMFHNGLTRAGYSVEGCMKQDIFIIILILVYFTVVHLLLRKLDRWANRK